MRVVIRAVCAAILMLACLACLGFAQGTAPPTIGPEQTSAWDVMQDPGNIALVSFVAANIADAKTDWRFTGPITGKAYVITPAQRVGIAGGTVMAALAVKHFWPKAGKVVDVAVGVATAYFAGRALANTYNHGGAGGMPN